MQKGCLRIVLLIVTVAAFGLLRAGRLQDNLELGVRSQQFTEALVAGRSQDIYQLFCPEFRQEHSFARFDSAFQRWFAGRTIARARRRVEEVTGLGGHVSTWVVFERARDYQYLFQSWIRTNTGWQLVWVSRLLDRSFDYGRKDTANVRLVIEAALRHALSPAGLSRLGRNFRRPDTLLMLQRETTAVRIPSVDKTVLIWLTADELTARCRLQPPPFVMAISGVRVLETVAVVAVDLLPSRRRDFGSFGRNRGQQIYLKRTKDGWAFASVGKAW